jgi:hypothetical protein
METKHLYILNRICFPSNQQADRTEGKLETVVYITDQAYFSLVAKKELAYSSLVMMQSSCHVDGADHVQIVYEINKSHNVIF